MRRLALVGDVLKHLGTTPVSSSSTRWKPLTDVTISLIEQTGRYDFVHHGISGGRTEAN